MKTDDEQYRQAAIELLRQKGTAAAIGPLRQLMKGPRKTTVSDTIRAIENRGAIPVDGSLSVVDHRADGQLTIVADSGSDVECTGPSILPSEGAI